ncbi:VOC family protein [Sphaerisporangium corydalis]|uniref:VOC family protein n=1 Tax=Sphaerisporangium corydalis TaxID=1441875 RepID=A0ABV9EQH0_9ACTN|nr:VOC family protein [Sphaerisporangium corydalis]
MTSNEHPHTPAWFDISTPDAPRARRFYQEMFGWPVNVIDETYALVGDDHGRPAGGIGHAGPGSPYTGFVAYFRVDDVDAALASAEKLGGTRVMEPTDTPTGRIAAFADPDGNPVGLLSS